MHLSGINIEENIKDSSLCVNYTPPATKRYSLDIGVCEFNFNRETSPHNWSKKEFPIKQKSFFCLKFNQELPFEEFFEYIIRFQNFLVLGTGSEIFPTQINVNRNFTSESLIPINLIYSWEHIISNPIDKHIIKMSFPFNKIEHQFGKVLDNWFKKYQDLLPVFNLFFEHEYKRLIFNENTFMNIIQALETFHRRLSSNTTIPFEEHQQKIEKILNTVGPEHREWLSGKLKYSHEPSLAQRLDSVITQYPSPVFDHLINNKKKKFIFKTVDNRNYYTHYDKSLENKKLPMGKLYKINFCYKSTPPYLYSSGNWF